MRLSKKRLKLTLVAALFAGLILCSLLFLRSIRASSTGLGSSDSQLPSSITGTASSSKKVKVAYGLPVRLKIPAIALDASLDYVSLTVNGELGVPTVPANAAWFDQGPRPGEKGNSVIDGHFGWVNNTPAVFDNLNKVHQGDNLYVQDDHNVTTAFVVTNVQTLGQNQSAKTVFVSNDDKAHLNLITCGGAWNQTQQSYSERLVVFADKIPQP